MGVSIAPVSSMGKLPQCYVCGQAVGRGLFRTQTKKKEVDKRYPAIHTYHLGCCDDLTPDEIRKLRSLVGSNNTIDDTEKEALLAKYKTYLENYR